MAKVSYTDPNLAEISGLYNSARVSDRFSFSRVVKKNVFLSPEKIAILKNRSYLKSLAAIWKNFSPAEKLAWKNVDPRDRKNGWQVFVKDQSLRFKTGLSGFSTPNQFHQASVGTINIESGAGRYMIKQSHPNTYFVQRRIAGKKGMLESVKIREDFYLPLVLSLSYKTNFVADGDNPYCKFYARIISHYQGRDIETDLLIDMPLITNWRNDEFIEFNVLGVARYYDLYFDLNNVSGNVFFDNIKAEHNGQNWVRDWQCDKIEQNFTRTWQQIAQNWELIIDSPLAYHASGYLDE